MNIIIKILLKCTLISYVYSLNILAIFPYQGKSHFFVYEVYLNELAKRGHNVTVISHFPQKNPPSNYRDISLAYDTEVIEGSITVERSYWTVFEIGIDLVSKGVQNCDHMLDNKEVQQLVKNKPKFDVVVIELFNSDCGLGIAYKLEAPVVGISSFVLMPWHYARFGIPDNPSYVSFHFLEGGTKPTLYQRIERLFFKFYFNNIYYFVSQRSNQNSLLKYYDDIPPLEDLARDIKFHLLYQNFILTQSILLPSNVIEIGGFHVAKAKPLTGDLQTFVDGAKKGVIFISFGTVVGSLLSPDKFVAIIEAVKELPQRFILKNANKTLAIKNKLLVSDWLPQVDILGHKNIVAFYSHGGMGSTTEAIHYGVPMVVMPLFGDQPANAAAIEESGLGVQIHAKDLTKENLVEAFKTVLEPNFREKVKQLSAAWYDRPLPPLDTAIYWTEYAARNSNFTFRSAAADVPFYQYAYLDVSCIILSGLLAFTFLVKRMLKLCCNSKITSGQTNKTKANKKKSKRE